MQVLSRRLFVKVSTIHTHIHYTTQIRRSDIHFLRRRLQFTQPVRVRLRGRTGTGQDKFSALVVFISIKDKKKKKIDNKFEE
jgi:hypothetical protein